MSVRQFSILRFSTFLTALCSDFQFCSFVRALFLWMLCYDNYRFIWPCSLVIYIFLNRLKIVRLGRVRGSLFQTLVGVNIDNNSLYVLIRKDTRTNIMRKKTAYSKWTYELSCNDYRVAALFKLYLNVTGIILQSLKSIGQSKHAQINKKS